MPSGAKPVKFETADVSIRRRPSPLRRLTALTLSPVDGCSTDQPVEATAAESRTTAAQRITNRVAGSGRRFPAHSTVSRNRSRAGFFGALDSAGGIR